MVTYDDLANARHSQGFWKPGSTNDSKGFAAVWNMAIYEQELWNIKEKLRRSRVGNVLNFLNEPTNWYNVLWIPFSLVQCLISRH